jgi:hypothetical protein
LRGTKISATLRWHSSIETRLHVFLVALDGELSLPVAVRSPRTAQIWSSPVRRQRGCMSIMHRRSEGKVPVCPTQASRFLSWVPSGPAQHCAGQVRLVVARPIFFLLNLLIILPDLWRNKSIENSLDIQI